MVDFDLSSVGDMGWKKGPASNLLLRNYRVHTHFSKFFSVNNSQLTFVPRGVTFDHLLLSQGWKLFRKKSCAQRRSFVD